MAFLDYFRESGKALHQASKSYREHDYPKVIELCDDAISRSPRYFRAYYARSLAYMGQGDYNAALADINEMIELSKQRPRFLRLLSVLKAQVYYLKGNMPRAFEATELAFKAASNSRQWLAYAYAARGLLYQSQEDTIHAISDYNDALEQLGGAIFASQSRVSILISVLCGRSICFSMRGMHTYALGDITRAEKLRPSDSQRLGIYQAKAIVANNNGDTEQALQYCEEVFRLASKYPTTAYIGYHNRGRIFKKQQQYEKAISDLTEAIRLFPQNCNAYIMRSEIYQTVGNTAASEADQVKIKELQADPPPMPSRYTQPPTKSNRFTL